MLVYCRGLDGFGKYPPPRSPGKVLVEQDGFGIVRDTVRVSGAGVGDANRAIVASVVFAHLVGARVNGRKCNGKQPNCELVELNHGELKDRGKIWDAKLRF